MTLHITAVGVCIATTLVAGACDFVLAFADEDQGPGTRLLRVVLGGIMLVAGVFAL